MYKKIIALITTFLIIISVSACGNKKLNEVGANTNDVSNSTNDKIDVVVTFNPLREFAEAVGKDKVNVKTLINEAIEPHDFEPKPRDLENISKGKVFVYNGVEMEPWIDKVIETISNKSLILVDSSKGTNLIKTENDEEEEENEEDHEHGEYDPHIWLSLKEAKVQANNIKEALIKVDPAGKDYYDKNYNEFTQKLDSLYNEYNEKISKLTNRKFVTGHAAFSYLCRDFNLEQNSVEDVFAEGEPSAKRLKELVEYGKKNNIKTIFSEENASPRVSETLAKEIGAKIEKIYSLESKQDNKNYIESMRENLEKIYISLK